MHDLPAGRFLTITAVAATLVFVIVQLTEHLPLHASINALHRSWADPIMAYGTHLADGWVTTGIGLVLMFVRWRWFLLMAVGTVGSSLVVQSLKHLLFDDVSRPVESMAAMGGLYLVPGVEMLHQNSFPSGHSACAFSMCMALAVIIGRGGPALALGLLAVCLAFTRVYLSQHFTEDVLCGACIGTLTTWCAYRWLCVSDFSRKRWLGSALLRRQNQ